MTLHFNDISHYQGSSFPISGPILAKATEGTSYTDGQYANNKKKTLALGFPFGGYHFLHKGNIDAQAAHAYAVMGKTPAMLDVEKAGDGSFPSWAETKAFILAYRKLGGIIHLAYIPKWFWRDYWGSPDMSWLALNNVALISSQYVHTYSDTGPGWDAYGGIKPKAWQYTDGDTSRGYSYGLHGVDTNAFKGTQAELGDLFLHGPNYQEDDMSAADVAAINAHTDAQVAALRADVMARIDKVASDVALWDPKTKDLSGMEVPWFQNDSVYHNPPGTNYNARPAWFPPQIMLQLHAIAEKLGVDIANLKNEAPK